MDVRCERCATEYELDDDSVPAGGCPVQCTSCGHTFHVQKPGAGTVAESLPSPATAEWLLETSDGRLHRFRNLTSLQKWIIERKVTREDKISRTGQAWRRLGEIVELAPFFDVVDEADRARAAQAASTSEGDALKAEAHRARSAGSARPSAPQAQVRSPQPVFRSTPRSRASTPHELRDAHLTGSGLEDPGFVDIDTSVVPVQRTGFKVAVALLVAAGLTAGAVFLLRTGKPGLGNGGTTSQPLAAPAPEPPASEPPPAPEPPPPSLPAEAAPVPPGPATASAEPPSAPAAPEAPVALPTAAPQATPPAEEAPASYDRLVVDADRLLENGSSDRASKLYERALKLNPKGVEAQAGLGYVMLDKGRLALAIAHFDRALGQASSYGPALFGLAEAQRAQGDEARALAGYRRYLQVNPDGEDAPAARRQQKLLEEKLADRGPESDPAATISRRPSLAPPSAEGPAAVPEGPPPSPTSVLGEPGAP